MLISLLKKIHYSIPPRIQIVYMFFVNIARKFRYFILPVYSYTGKEKASGQSIKIIYMGWDKRISFYWTKRLLREKYSEHKNKIIPAWNINNYLSKNIEGHDLAIVETNSFTRRFFKSNVSFLLPRWIEMQLNGIESLKKKKRKEIKRLIRKNSLTFNKSHSKEDIKFFHQRMFIPFISKRHGESAVLCDYNFFLNKFRKKGSQINFILKDGKPIAGSFIELIGGRRRLTGMGILDGRLDILRIGVVGAIYYFELLDAIKNSITPLDIGGTSPILTDGLTQFKLSLGAKVEDIKYFIDLTLCLIPVKDKLVTKNILKSNPFIHRIKDNLFRSIFVDPSDYEDKQEFIRFLNQTNCTNITGTNIYCFNDPDKITAWIKEERYNNIQVLKYSIN